MTFANVDAEKVKKSKIFQIFRKFVLLGRINQLRGFDDFFVAFLNEKICKYQKFFVSLYKISKQKVRREDICYISKQK